jgi:hypothetical protein
LPGRRLEAQPREEKESKRHDLVLFGFQKKTGIHGLPRVELCHPMKV